MAHTRSRIPQDFRKLLAFGSGVGIEIGASRSGSGGGARAAHGVKVLGRLDIADFADPAGGRVGRRVRPFPADRWAWGT